MEKTSKQSFADIYPAVEEAVRAELAQMGRPGAGIGEAGPAPAGAGELRGGEAGALGPVAVPRHVLTAVLRRDRTKWRD